MWRRSIRAVAGAQHAAGVHKGAVAQGQDLAAHDPRHGQPGDRAQPAKQGGELQPLRRAVGEALRPALPFRQPRVQGGDEHMTNMIDGME